MQPRVLPVIVLAFAMAVGAPTDGCCWGWIGHRLITRLAVQSLPDGPRAIYAGLDAQLDDATVYPDKASLVSPREAMRHFLNIEVLDAGFREVLMGLPPVEEDAPVPHGSPAPARPARPARPAPATGAALAPAPGGGDPDTEEPGHHGPVRSPGEEKLRQAEMDYFRDKLPAKSASADGYFAQLPGDWPTMSKTFKEAQQRAIGIVTFQPAFCFGKLVAGLRARDQHEVVFWTGKLSHYLGDSSQPLHNTVNHNGKISGNLYLDRSGPDHSVHSRFESGLMKFMGVRLEPGVKKLLRAPALLSPGKLVPLTLAQSRAAYEHIPEILKLDADYFRGHQAGDRISWEKYYTTMEPSMGALACRQLASATQMLSDALLTAWEEAGKPLPPLPPPPAPTPSVAPATAIAPAAPVAAPGAAPTAPSGGIARGASAP